MGDAVGAAVREPGGLGPAVRGAVDPAAGEMVEEGQRGGLQLGSTARQDQARLGLCG